MALVTRETRARAPPRRARQAAVVVGGWLLRARAAASLPAVSGSTQPATLRCMAK